MILGLITPATPPSWPRLWRMAMVALGTLILCSCQGPIPPACYTALDQAEEMGLPPEAYTGVSAPDLSAGAPPTPPGIPIPYTPSGPWSPPGIRRPWPQDEYLADGGDRGLPARVAQQWEVQGLEPEDTVAHYDTLAGQTIVQPSNRVYIYSPRFGAVRQVVGLVANEQSNRAAGVHFPERLAAPATTQLATTSTQNVQPDYQVSARPPVIYRGKRGDGAMSNATGPRGIQQDFFLPYEDLRIIREGVIDAAEMGWLARGSAAAEVWSREQQVQVILDHRAATVVANVQTSPTVYTVEQPPPRPELRVVKVASTGFAEPGDEVAFTIRFDNVGNELIGNVTVIDNLTTRLEYVPDSAQCSLPAEFFTEPNQGDSLALRCELADPLPPGEGGVIRFRCRVR